MKFKDIFTENIEVKVGQIWLQNTKSKGSKRKDVIEIISLLGTNSVDVKSSEKDKIITLPLSYINSSFILSRDV